MYRRTATAVVALTATAGLLAGCGSSSSGGSKNAANLSGSSAASELSSAISALGQSATVTATLKLGVSGSQLLSFVHAQDSSSKLTSQEADTLAGSSVNFEVAAPSGKTLSQVSGLANDGAADISLIDNGKTFFTIRLLNQTMYVQVDLKDLLNSLGQQQTYRQFAGAGSQLPSFLSALVQGKWVSLSLSALKGLTSPLAGGASSPNPAQAKHFVDELRTLLTKDVTVTRTSSGGTDTLTLTTNLRTFAGDFTTTFASSIPGAGAALSSTNLSNVPNKNVSMTATVSGGALSTLSLDLGQFTKSGKGSLPLLLSFVRSGPSISAPSGAVAVDLSQLGGLLGGLGGGGL